MTSYTSYWQLFLEAAPSYGIDINDPRLVAIEDQLTSGEVKALLDQAFSQPAYVTGESALFWSGNLDAVHSSLIATALQSDVPGKFYLAGDTPASSALSDVTGITGT